ncbi:hypothetical protein [Yoonia sediminilitoris]|uniref:Flp pilus assembly pilin Flp n=1 Tax=Yoonia sediminilitoris TaxID=1286148 RepID=A0A2T6KK48_9RHOB|nr:hypothetical protein [Yoonia sediminilitoris]PUB16315.1 hypothetical protein C8N45_103169 [Yoonia sediminilitoris]RCW96664.1 hypothetical protein DFP92_103169 [Yoonia sediminilitoris]
MITLLKKFRGDENGAVTVDFVVLTAAIVVLGLAVGQSISAGAVELADKQEQSLTDRPLGTDW